MTLNQTLSLRKRTVKTYLGTKISLGKVKPIQELYGYDFRVTFSEKPYEKRTCTGLTFPSDNSGIRIGVRFVGESVR